MKRITIAAAIALIMCAITILPAKLSSDVHANLDAKPLAKVAATAEQNAPCNATIKVGKPALTGQLPRPTAVTVGWTVENLPPCYRISNSRVTFNIVAQDGTNETLGPVTVNGDRATASAPISLTAAKLDKLFPKARPAVITATVQTTAVPNAPSYTHTDVETAEVKTP